MANNDQTLIRQLQAWANDLAEQIPAHQPGTISLRNLGEPSRRFRGLTVMAVAAVVVLAMGTVLLWRAQDDRTGDLFAGAGALARYEWIEYSQQATLQCPGSELNPGGEFTQMTFEAWGSPELGRWRNTVTYPDGSTRDLIAVGSPYYPTAIYVRGSQKGQTQGCQRDEGEGILASEPGQQHFFSVNPLAEIPITTFGNPAHLTYVDLGTKLDGTYLDSRGRPASRWRQTVTGFSGATERRAVTQVTDWFVNPETGQVLESTYSNQIDGVGTATSRVTVIESREVTVASNSFDTNGYLLTDAGGRTPPPTRAPGSSAATTARPSRASTTSASTPQTQPCVTWVAGRADGTEERGSTC